MSNLGTRLIEHIQAADTDGVVRLLAPLSEPERARLADIARGAFEDLRRREHEAMYGRGGPDLHLREGSRLGKCQRVAALAWLGTGEIEDFPEAVDIGQDHGAWDRWSDFWRACGTEAAHQILTDRRPTWLAKGVQINNT